LLVNVIAKLLLASDTRVELSIHLNL